MENTLVKPAKVIDSNNCGNVGYKIVETEHNRYMVYENIRHEEGDFNSLYYCSICDPNKEKFRPKLIKLQIGGEGAYLLVCRSCICNMEEVLKAAQYFDCEFQERVEAYNQIKKGK
jgi:hypothetical protein